MSRSLRNFLFFLIGFSFMLPMLVFAETQPLETTGLVSGFSGTGGKWATTRSAVAQLVASANGQCTGTGYPNSQTASSGTVMCPSTYFGYDIAAGNWWAAQGCGAGFAQVGSLCQATSCPSGQNWTLNGKTCTRPDCDSGQIRDPSTGLCNAPQCTLGANAKIGMDMFETPRPQPSGVTWCIQNCQAYITTSWHTPTKNYGYAYVNGAGGSASTCQSSGSNEPVPTSAPPEPPAPPCASGQGVVTNSSGKVLCVDQNTVPTSEPPKVNKQVDTVTNPDGSQTITNTIQTCTGAGACSTVTNVTITNASNGQPGTAGTPGTTTAVSDKPSSEQSGFCAQNPSLEICKGGMNQEATQAKVLAELEKINKPTVTDDSGISGKTFETTSGRDALTDKDDQLKNYSSGVLTVSGVESNKSAWESAMSGGWFDSIPSVGCSPYTATFSGRTWVFDYCEKAALISEIGAYGLWFMLAVGSFVMLTGGKKE